MNIPESVKIGYKDYKVDEQEHLNDDTRLLDGQIDYGENKIHLFQRLTDADKKATLLHEIIHGIDRFMIIGLSEEQVEKLGEGLAMVIRDNESALFC